jgi:hypothetical protein
MSVKEFYSLSLAHTAAHIGEAAEYTSCECVLTAAGQTLCFLAAANAHPEKSLKREIYVLSLACAAKTKSFAAD